MPLQPGDRFGSYDVLAALGSGGMGDVYKAKDTKLKRDVALKVLPAAFLRDSERIARFQREAEVLASLNHANIAQIYVIEEVDGVRALVMELVPGETLASGTKPGPLPLETALRYAKQIAEALEAAHDKGITHRDLKPANIMITPASPAFIRRSKRGFLLTENILHIRPAIRDSPMYTSRPCRRTWGSGRFQLTEARSPSGAETAKNCSSFQSTGR